MPISNIEAKWSSGDLTFQNKSTKSAIMKIDDAGTVTIGTAPDWTTSNTSASRTLDATETTPATIANNLATLIEDLQSLGILQ